MPRRKRVSLLARPGRQHLAQHWSEFSGLHQADDQHREAANGARNETDNNVPAGHVSRGCGDATTSQVKRHCDKNAYVIFADEVCHANRTKDTLKTSSRVIYNFPFADHLSVSSFASRMKCSKCDRRNISVRPAWRTREPYIPAP